MVVMGCRKRPNNLRHVHGSADIMQWVGGLHPQQHGCVQIQNQMRSDFGPIKVASIQDKNNNNNGDLITFHPESENNEYQPCSGRRW